MMLKRAIFLLMFMGLVTMMALYRLSKSRTFQFFGGLTNRVSISEKVVALTFDDAPSAHSDAVVATLASRGVRATFYVIGENAIQYPAQLHNIVTQGNELGNHSYSHQRFLFKPWSFIDAEIQKTNQIIRDVGYVGNVTFRPPNGKKLFLLPWYLRQHGLKTIMWDVEPDTFVPEMADDAQRAQALANYTLQQVQPGSIILLHPFCESCNSDRLAIGPLIDALQSQGYRLVTVSELLAIAAK